MREKPPVWAAILVALFAGAAPGAAATFGPPAHAGAAAEALTDAPPPAGEGALDFAFGVSAEPDALFRIPEAAEPPVEGPFARYADRRSSRASLVPWELGPGDERFAANATFFPLVGGALLLAWLLLSEGRPAMKLRRRRARRASRKPPVDASSASA